MKTISSLFFTVAAFIFLNVLPSTAAAQTCANPYRLNLQGPASISFDPVTPVGATLWSGTVYAAAVGGGCAGGTMTVQVAGTGAPLMENLYDSGVPGIAYRLRFAGRGLCTTAWWPSSCTGTWAPGMSDHQLYIELVKTGPITGGGSLTGVFANWLVGSSVYATYSWVGSVVVKPVVPTCSVSTESRAISVALGSNLPLSTFTGVGSISAPKPFNIALQCSGGDAGRTTNVYVTLTDQTNPANRSNVLSLTPDSGASGIGIQVLKGTTILSYGPDSAAAGTTNQWSAGAAANGVFSIPLTARYVQTAPSVKGGKANGRATFTMSYQ
ncbi:Fimbrial protein [compost metagenome]